MLRPKVTTLPGHIQAVYVQNVVKLYASMLQQMEQDSDTEAAQELTRLMVERLPQFVQSADLEVQERVCTACQATSEGARRSLPGVCGQMGHDLGHVIKGFRITGPDSGRSPERKRPRG